MSRAIGGYGIVGVRPLAGFVGNEILEVRTKEAGTVIVKAGTTALAIEREAAVCAYANDLGVLAPEVTVLDTSATVLPKPYFAMRRAEGSAQATWDDDGRRSPSVREQCARQLAVLHTSSQEKVRTDALRVNSSDQSWSGWIKERMESQTVELERVGILSPEMREQVRARLEDAFLAARDQEAGSLLHGDFHPRHSFVDEEFRLRQIIDWGDALVGDPLYDLGRLAGVLDRGGLTRFVNEYDAQLAPDLIFPVVDVYALSWTINAMHEELQADGDWFEPHRQVIGTLLGDRV
jgi:aminoglycoside phosphotransferase (APT) family kinase protein